MPQLDFLELVNFDCLFYLIFSGIRFIDDKIYFFPSIISNLKLRNKLLDKLKATFRY